MNIQVNIISYGYAHLASHCIESALSQTRKPDKILVVDDGKHDGIEKWTDTRLKSSYEKKPWNHRELQ